MLYDTIIKIIKINPDYSEIVLYSHIRAEVQARLYNIKDVLTNVSEEEDNEKYYITIDKKYTLISVWDIITYTDDFWTIKRLKITSFWMEKFISKWKFIEIKAADF